MYVSIRDLRSFDIRFEFEFESDVPIRILFESDEPHMPCAITPQTALTHCSTKTSTFAPFLFEIYVYNSTLQDFTCSCTAVARAHTQLPHDNRNWTCKRLPPDSLRYSIKIKSYPPILFEIWFERKFPIRRSLVCMYVCMYKNVSMYVRLCGRAPGSSTMKRKLLIKNNLKLGVAIVLDTMSQPTDFGFKRSRA